MVTFSKFKLAAASDAVGKALIWAVTLLLIVPHLPCLVLLVIAEWSHINQKEQSENQE